MVAVQELPVLALMLIQVVAVNRPKLIRTMYMANMETCGHTESNDKVAFGDYIMVVSDFFRGAPPGDIDSAENPAPDDRTPVECQISIDYGDHYVSVSIEEFWCQNKKGMQEISLVVYNGCGKDKELMTLNCSVDLEKTQIKPVYSTSTCVTVYHYRGRQTYGYSFILAVKADKEVFPLSAEGMAAAFIGTLVALMIILKLACVLTGYEDRLPTASNRKPPAIVRVLQSSVNSESYASDKAVEDEDSVHSDLSPTVVHMLSSSPRPSLLHGYSPEYLDVPGPRRFSGFRTSSIWRK